MKKISKYNYKSDKCKCGKEITRNATQCGHCTHQKYDKILTKEFLYKEYIVNKKTMRQIAKQVECGVCAVETRLKKFNIKTRSISEAVKGKNNPFFGKYHTKEAKIKMSLAHKGKLVGKDNPSWLGGISKLPYLFKFNKKLKKQIRNRDNHTCQLCGMTEENHLNKYKQNLCIHHIDYDKKNCDKNNLISLCNSCHGKTSMFRGFWREYFEYLINKKKPTREQAIKLISKTINKNALVISSLGMTSRFVYKLLDKYKPFYLVGGMGSCLSVAMGIALNTKKKIIAITGDGETLMGLGTLVTHKRLNPKNLWHFILDNNQHASTGGQKTISNKCDFKSLSPNTIVIKIKKGKGNAGRIPLTGKQIKERFLKVLNE